MARAALYFEGEQLAERGYKVPKRIERIESWSKSAVKTFQRELKGRPMMLVKSTVTTTHVRLGYACGHGILIDRRASPLG